MKRMILATGALLISMSALADTVSQRTAKEMTAVLQSQEVQALLSQEDGVGNLDGIKYLSSGRASFGPSQYEVSFKSYFGPAPQTCKVIANVNIRTVSLMDISQATCVEIK